MGTALFMKFIDSFGQKGVSLGYETMKKGEGQEENMKLEEKK